MPCALHLCAPWVQCRRDDFKIRAETDALLRQSGINPDWLVYQDDFQLPDEPPASGISLSLLDHNKLSPMVTRSLEWPANHVSAVWDHHADQGLYKAAEPRQIEFDYSAASGLGSCCTIIAEHMLGSTPELLKPSTADASPIEGLPESVAAVSSPALSLLGVILLDTGCLSEAAGKAKPRDIAAADALARCIGMTDGGRGHGAKALFEDLSSRKFSRELWASLSLASAVGADYKQSHLTASSSSSAASSIVDAPSLSIGYASVLAPIDTVLASACAPLSSPTATTTTTTAAEPSSAASSGISDVDSIAEQLAHECCERNIDALLILGFTLDDGEPPTPVRELLLFCPQASQPHAPDRTRRVAAAVSALQAPAPARAVESASAITPTTNPFKLDCQTAAVGVDSDGCAVSTAGTTVRWSQGNAKASRKQIRPAFETCLMESLVAIQQHEARL